MHVDDEAGVPPLAFAQLLDSAILDSGAVSRFRRILVREGTDEASLVQRDRQVPLRWFREVYPDLDGDRATQLGRAFAERAQLTSFGPLSLPLVSAGSVTEIVQLLNYLPLITTAVSPQFHPVNRGLAVGLTGHTGDPFLDMLAIAYTGSTLLRLLELLVADVSAVILHLSWPAPASMKGHEDVLVGRLSFDASLSFLDVPDATLDEVCRFADPLAYRHAIADLERSLARRGGGRTVARAVKQLLDGDTRLRSSQSVAAELTMSASTLKRRLTDEGTSFREVRDSSLYERAILNLLDRSLSLTDVAADLGYSDLSNFSHAFKRWTGVAPSQFRQDQAR